MYTVCAANKECANRASVALEAYNLIMNNVMPCDTETVQSLLTDILHWEATRRAEYQEVDSEAVIEVLRELVETACNDFRKESDNA